MRSGVLVGVCALLAFGALSAPGLAQEKTKVRFGVLTTASQTAFLVGAKKGIFEKHGFDVEVTSLATGVQANQALAADQVDWSGGGMESTIVAWGTDLPFKAYSMYAKGGDSYGILVRKDANIKTLADLKGKRVAVPQGTAPAQGLNQVLQSVGLPFNAVQRVNANYSNMGQMLIQGAVDAMAGLEPFLTLTQEKMGDQAVLLTRLGKYVQGGGFFLISNKWAAAHQDKVKDAVLALWEAQHFVRHNPQEAAKLESEFLKVEPRIVEIAFKSLQFLPTIDEFTRKSLENTAAYLKSEGFLPREVDVPPHLKEANSIIADLGKTHPDLLK